MEQAIRSYLDSFKLPDPAAICLAVAGPVKEQEVRLTNNYWHIESKTLSRQFSGASVTLINDFTAIAYSIPFLKADESLT